ncbi:LAME_0D09098g1_1 [Lachancea meyersii CBS 8951]|uniref:LAME_0D09098g1_1 n=1 Tax=Lachancea meyersii CBS 8951 TaxID=1266667 RepID=A0A1G4JB59_9SACH|nr:LAME_0D09098g1_1 [Lachancea meyersii CBS 8951]
MGQFQLIATVKQSQGSKQPFTAAKISPNGQKIALCNGPDIEIYDIHEKTSVLLSTLHSRPLSDLCWSPDSQCVATASDDFTVIITHVAYGELHRLVGHTAPVTALKFTHKGNLLCSCSMDESIKIWDTLTGSLLRTLSAHSEPVVSIDIPPHDASILSSGSYDGLIRIFDTATGHCLKTLTYDKDWQSENGVVPISQVRFSVNGKFLLVKSLDGILKIWDFVRGKVVRTFISGESNSLRYTCGMDFLYPAQEADDPIVVSGTETGEIVCWDSQTKQLQHRIKRKHCGNPVMDISCHGSLMCSISLCGECNLWTWVDSESTA